MWAWTAKESLFKIREISYRTLTSNVEKLLFFLYGRIVYSETLTIPVEYKRIEGFVIGC